MSQNTTKKSHRTTKKQWTASAWSPADKVSLARVVVAPTAAIACYLNGASWPGWWLVWIAIGLTDMLDGKLARRFGGTERGATLDEMSDKVCMLAAFLVCGTLGRVAWYLILLMVMRDVGITLLRVRMRRQKLDVIKSARWMGKVKTVGQFGLVAVALYPPAPWQATVVILSGAVVTVISIMSGVQYLALSLYAKDPSWLAGKPRLGAPNWISAFRLALALIVPYIFIAGPFGEWSFAVGVIVGTVACLTDAVDGFIARMWRLKTDFGKIFDPIADKAAQYLLALGLIAAEWTIVPWWLALLAGVCLVGRDIACLTWFVLMQERIGAGWCDKLRSVAVVAWLGSLAWVGFTGEQVDLSNGILLFAAVASVISLFADWRRIEKK